MSPAPGHATPILVAEDDPVIRESLVDWLTEAGYKPFDCATGAEALEVLERERMWLLLTDLKMPGMDGIELMRRAKQIVPGIYVIIITAYGTVTSAVEAIRSGAFEYIEKPFCLEALVELLGKTVAHRRMMEERVHHPQTASQQDRLDDLIGKSSAMRKVFELIRLVAASQVTVLIQGESGTGKELVAQAIHKLSPRGKGPFVTTACAALTETLLDSELFGHEKGSFTGATDRKKGTFELAGGGTLLLDEIGEISPNTQIHLLRVLEERAVRRVGGTELIPLDIRLVSATNRDLMAEVEAGRFREDLYYRLNVMCIEVPPLRERRVDIMLLADYFLARLAGEHGKSLRGFTTPAFQALLAHGWPGNVRELRNAVEHAVVVAHGEYIDRVDLPDSLCGGEPCAPLVDLEGASLRDVERQHIQHVLEQTDWNRTRAARILGIQRMTLYNKIRDYSIEIPEDKRQRSTGEGGALSPGPWRVLLVEDEELTRDALASWLENLGHEVIEAGSGPEALTACAGPPPDVALLDLRLPGMHGMELLVELRRLVEGLPVILMTGYADTDSVRRAAELGAAALLEKPFDPAQLEGHLLRAIRG